MDKKQTLEILEYEIKLTSLQVKYAKHFDSFFFLIVKLRSLIFQYFVVRSQPIPKNETGSIVGINKEEIIQLPDGKQIKLFKP